MPQLTLTRNPNRGKPARTRFQRDCLGEYSEVFKTVCVDAEKHSFTSTIASKEMRSKLSERCCLPAISARKKALDYPLAMRLCFAFMRLQLHRLGLDWLGFPVLRDYEKYWPPHFGLITGLPGFLWRHCYRWQDLKQPEQLAPCRTRKLFR